ncbi:MAG: DUF4433 domain-containing protein [Gomphosphaeria aponina SAG 52.96 = DSM 107014]|uniref:DUF4433 domain-containing protein n=1 Tax=Gomphosphaeria aponina SAG 52.96 = DSM 107014 TaxID=1521640 RepID=A0A941JTQ0_9CHRO|nr:DUF4433 domain-containing protein [Gomphosphaeria aponina SAG 52.96 = DSM 107014]
MPRFEIKNLYYITQINNLPSILEKGILSPDEIKNQHLEVTRIYDQEIVSNRQRKNTPEQKSLWEYANLYFQPRNPMMYRVIQEEGKRNLAIIAIRNQVLSESGVVITDGNAASNETRFYPLDEGMEVLSKNWQIIQKDWWKGEDGSKRKIMAECLIPKKVNPSLIEAIFVTDTQTQEQVKKIIEPSPLPIIPEPNLFFQPNSTSRIGNISLINGDMFFSQMQTLTVSVNLEGIMGKGLASRAKYQFPDVYVVYQDACKAKNITATQPFLYRREVSLDQELADLSLPLNTPNSVKWFLLLATKRKWRENSRLEDLEGGLDWIKRNFKAQGITSLALPALGCGLGKLTWLEVGPLMCRYLYDIGINVAIYLPREGKIAPEYLQPEFLLH